MAEVTLIFADRTSSPDYFVPSASFSGEATTRFAEPEGYRQWVTSGTVRAGSVLEWADNHGDEALYLDDGRVEIEGQVCEAGGAVIVERGAHARLVFVEDCSVVHMGHADQSPGRKGPADLAARVHVFGPPVVGPDNAERFTDGSCPSCDIVFFKVSGEDAHVGRAHSHTANELLYVLGGTLRVGPNRVEAGMAIAVPANRIYSFRTDGPWAFLNYRLGPSEMHWARTAREL